MRMISFKRLVLICALFFSTQVFGTNSVWLSDSSYLRENYSQVRDFEQYLFSPLVQYSEETDAITDLQTQSALIIKDGKIIYEKYARGYDKDRPQKLWSISKSITNLLIGIAVKEDRISLKDNICKFFSDYNLKSNCARITVEHLLGWSSGIHWRESFDSPFSSSIINLIYSKKGYADSTAFILSHPLITTPGSSWNYSSGDTNLLMAILSKAYSDKEYSALPWTKLFNELGIQSAVWDKDGKGVFNGCCSLYATIRDLARVGQFMLKEGQWMGRDYLPYGWIKKYVTSISPSFLKNPVLMREQFVPGFHWWVNKPSQHGQVYKPKALISAPSDIFVAVGYSGQFLFVIPSLNMLFIRTGQISNTYLDINAMLGKALSVVTGNNYDMPVRDKPIPFSIGQAYNPPKNYKQSESQFINNVIAKEMCNCIFIEKETQPQCTELLKDYIQPFQNISISQKKKTVSVSFLKFFQLSRSFFNGRYGCSLI